MRSPVANKFVFIRGSIIREVIALNKSNLVPPRKQSH